MLEYLTYSLADLLMFSPRVYDRLFERYNEAIWPAQILAAGLGLAIIGLLVRAPAAASRLIPAILGVLWLWVGWAFLWERFAVINWPLVYVAPLFALQAVLFVAVSAAGRGLHFPSASTAPDRLGLALFTATLFIYPFIATLSGRSWMSAELFGVTADPTAVGTAILLAVASGAMRWPLMIVPVLWCAVSSVTLWTLGAADFLVPIAGALVAVALAASGGSRRTGVATS